jgi:hypothetical protein
MAKPKQYKVYDKTTGDLLAEGTARQCAEVLRAPSDTIRAIARGKGSYKYLVEEQEKESDTKSLSDSGLIAAALRWDAFCEPIRKKYGIPVRHLGEGKK